MTTIKSAIKELLFSENRQWFLWAPVFYMLGIIFYFAMPFEPYVASGAVLLLPALLAVIYWRKNLLIFYTFIIISIISAGFLNASVKTFIVNSPKLDRKTPIISIEGTVSEISTYKSGNRVILSGIESEYFQSRDVVPPARIRLNVYTGMGGAKNGDRVQVRAALLPPPQAAYPGAYDFAKFAFYRKIGAIGYAVTAMEPLEQPPVTAFTAKIENLRQIIGQRLENENHPDSSQVAKALLVGDRGGMEQTVTDNLRDAGLAHLLAISGLHLALVCFIFFASTRLLLACIYPFALRFDTKKFAAISAIAGSYFYLLISGSPISAQRAFVMAVMVLLAILIDRQPTPIRVVAIAALAVMVFSPESVLFPSFQMSFAAVAALISTFGFLTPYFQKWRYEDGMPKIVGYFLSVIIASLVAGIATAPFAIYHFNHFSVYGLVSNLAAVPITSMVVMPVGIISVILMPLGLEWLTLPVMYYGIDIVTATAKFIAEIPYSAIIVPYLSGFQLTLMSLGFLWLALWQEKWRIYGVVAIIAATSLAFFNKSPDILINSDGGLFAVMNNENRLLFSDRRKGGYVRDVWMKRMAQNQPYYIDNTPNENINCDNFGCIYIKDGLQVVFSTHPAAFEPDCPYADIMVNLTSVDYTCEDAGININHRILTTRGTHGIYINNGRAEVKTVVPERKRAWH